MWVCDLTTVLDKAQTYSFYGMTRNNVRKALKRKGFVPYTNGQTRKSTKCSLSLLMHQLIYVETEGKLDIWGEKRGPWRLYQCTSDVWSAATADSTMAYSLKKDFWPSREGVN